MDHYRLGGHPRHSDPYESAFVPNVLFSGIFRPRKLWIRFDDINHASDVSFYFCMAFM